MGCDYYHVHGHLIHFSDCDDSYGCLCTFPHNYEPILDVDAVRSLALLGAAAVLVLEQKFGKDEYVFLPSAIPDWIKQEIDRVLNYQPPSEEID